MNCIRLNCFNCKLSFLKIIDTLENVICLFNLRHIPKNLKLFNDINSHYSHKVEYFTIRQEGFLNYTYRLNAIWVLSFNYSQIFENAEKVLEYKIKAIEFLLLKKSSFYQQMYVYFLNKHS